VALSGPSGGFMPVQLPISSLPRKWKESRNVPAATIKALEKGSSTHVDLLAVELDLQRCRDLGLMLGAGLVVYGDRADMVAEALNCVEFFRNESCGKCVPCRIGSQMIVEIAEELYGRRIASSEFAECTDLANELVKVMGMTSICGLGMVAGKPLASLLQFFRSEAEGYLVPKTR
jgi:NADH:ubiquinone oxidoreductase subunit F (NADH-binding)